MFANLNRKTQMVVLTVALTITETQLRAANYNVFTDRAANNAALNSTSATQTFSGYAADTNLDGVSFLSGVSVTSSLNQVVAWDNHPNPGKILFGIGHTTRQLGAAYYDLNLDQPYRATGFDITSYDPDAPGHGEIELFFGDSTTVQLISSSRIITRAILCFSVSLPIPPSTGFGGMKVRKSREQVTKRRV